MYQVARTRTQPSADTFDWAATQEPRPGGHQSSEPLFGEDWWTADQRLFEDSLARRETPRPPRRHDAAECEVSVVTFTGVRLLAVARVRRR
jgi:hypothetical protein